MRNLFVPYKIAVVLKEIGFNQPCLMCYYGEGKPEQPDKLYLPACFGKHTNKIPQRKEDVSAPLFQQVFEWFRKKHI